MAQLKRRDELANTLMEKQKELDALEKVKQEHIKAIEVAKKKELAKYVNMTI